MKRLLKVSRLSSKGIFDIYLKATVEKKWRTKNFDFLIFKISSPGHFLGGFHFTQISLNFQTSCCNLKIRGLGEKLVVVFLLFLFCKELFRFKVKESMLFVKQTYKLNKQETESKMENSTHIFIEMNLMLQPM